MILNKNGILSNIPAKLTEKLTETGTTERNMLLFAIEGILITLVNNLVNNNNNLFASRMNASDFQLSLVIALPQFVGMLVLIPGGILTDSMSNKRRMVTLSLFMLAAFYAVLGFVPFMKEYSLIAFLCLLALSVAPMTMYNASWQAYFSDVVPEESMNRTFSLRTQGTFLISILAPIVTGVLLSSTDSNDTKIMFHQTFFWAASLLLILQALVLKRISGGNVHSPVKTRLHDLKTAVTDLAHNKRFLGFVGVALFFYLTWQVDWTLYYIGQVTYLKLNEVWLSYVSIGGAVVQFLTIGFWSQMNEKYGVRFPIILGNLGLAFCPASMIIATSCSAETGPVVFLLLNTLSNFAFAAVMLNILQCLLQVIPEKNKTLSIAIYTVLVTFSNAVMPMIGVQVYSALGSTKSALQTTFLIIFAFRIVSTGLWTLRWWLLRNEPK
ncbi:MAG: MFS transporter [Clostridia bacterium]|nr:MFS transporter [Clostridia bacterium]